MNNLNSRLARLEASAPAHAPGEIPPWAVAKAEELERLLTSGRAGEILEKLGGRRDYDPAEVTRVAQALAQKYRDREEAEMGEHTLSPAAKELFERIKGETPVWRQL